MLPEIGIMVGFYILVRMAALVLKPKDQFSSESGRIIVTVLAIAAIIGTGVICIDLYRRGSEFADQIKFQ